MLAHNNKTLKSTNSTNTQLTSNESRSVSVPLQLNVNSEKYFVVGYPNNVRVDLTGPSALVTTTANTKNFKVVADLNRLTAGVHEVKLKQTGLNSELKAKIKPEKIKVNIQERKTATYPVQVDYSKKNIASGYKVSKAEKDISKAKITGPEEEVNKIKKVVAKVQLDKTIDNNLKQTTVIEALDEKGQTVNVVISPSTTTVNLTVEKENS